MDSQKPAFDTLLDAARRGDVEAIRQGVLAGFDLKSVDEYGDSLLIAAVREMSGFGDTPDAHRIEVATALLDLGFDPNQVTADGDGAFGPLSSAMLTMDTDMLRLLLSRGARPNDLDGHAWGTSLYTWAVDDYCIQTWNVFSFPEEPDEADRKDGESWLRWLDRMAIKHGRRRPDHLFLLREFGARTREELVAQSAKLARESAQDRQGTE